MNTDAETQFLYAVAARVTGISLANALGLMEDARRFLVAPAVPDLSTHEALVAFARTLPLVRENLRAGKKIQAIKELRTQGQAAVNHARNSDGYSIVGLKQAKDACDALAKEPDYQQTPSSCCNHPSFHWTWCHRY